jgi:hypothetical protein
MTTIQCVCPAPVIFKKNMPFNGNTNNSSKTNAMRYSELVRQKSSTSQYINTPVNAFGYYSGGPGGSGAPPRNKF